MPPRSDEDEPEGMLLLVRGLDSKNLPQYAYAIIPYDNYAAFLAAQASGNYDLRAFGTVVCHGAGSEPDAATKKEMEETYGAQHDFESALLAHYLES